MRAIRPQVMTSIVTALASEWVAGILRRLTPSSHQRKPRPLRRGEIIQENTVMTVRKE